MQYQNEYFIETNIWIKTNILLNLFDRITNLGKSGSQLEFEVRRRGNVQIESKLDIENPKLWLNKSRFLAWFKFARIPTCLHEY